ncbi:MAG: hypothetical protein WBA46_11125, partial [Thermomicrobiales bacterium]
RLQGKRWSMIFFVYAMSMGFGLVYLGEHYVVDVTMGGLIATFSWFMAGAILSRAETRRHLARIRAGQEAPPLMPDPTPEPEPRGAQGASPPPVASAP